MNNLSETLVTKKFGSLQLNDEICETSSLITSLIQLENQLCGITLNTTNLNSKYILETLGNVVKTFGGTVEDNSDNWESEDQTDFAVVSYTTDSQSKMKVYSQNKMYCPCKKKVCNLCSDVSEVFSSGDTKDLSSGRWFIDWDDTSDYKMFLMTDFGSFPIDKSQIIFNNGNYYSFIYKKLDPLASCECKCCCCDDNCCDDDDGSTEGGGSSGSGGTGIIPDQDESGVAHIKYTSNDKIVYLSLVKTNYGNNDSYKNPDGSNVIWLSSGMELDVQEGDWRVYWYARVGGNGNLYMKRKIDTSEFNVLKGTSFSFAHEYNDYEFKYHDSQYDTQESSEVVLCNLFKVTFDSNDPNVILSLRKTNSGADFKVADNINVFHVSTGNYIKLSEDGRYDIYCYDPNKARWDHTNTVWQYYSTLAGNAVFHGNGGYIDFNWLYDYTIKYRMSNNTVNYQDDSSMDDSSSSDDIPSKDDSSSSDDSSSQNDSSDAEDSSEDINTYVKSEFCNYNKSVVKLMGTYNTYVEFENPEEDTVFILQPTETGYGRSILSGTYKINPSHSSQIVIKQINGDEVTYKTINSGDSYKFEPFRKMSYGTSVSGVYELFDVGQQEDSYSKLKFYYWDSDNGKNLYLINSLAASDAASDPVYDEYLTTRLSSGSTIQLLSGEYTVGFIDYKTGEEVKTGNMIIEHGYEKSYHLCADDYCLHQIDGWEDGFPTSYTFKRPNDVYELRYTQLSDVKTDNAPRSVVESYAILNMGFELCSENGQKIFINGDISCINGRSIKSGKYVITSPKGNNIVIRQMVGNNYLDNIVKSGDEIYLTPFVKKEYGSQMSGFYKLFDEDHINEEERATLYYSDSDLSVDAGMYMWTNGTVSNYDSIYNSSRSFNVKNGQKMYIKPGTYTFEPIGSKYKGQLQLQYNMQINESLSKEINLNLGQSGQVEIQPGVVYSLRYSKY